MKDFLEKIDALGLDLYREPLESLILEKERYVTQVDAKGRRYLGIMENLPDLTPSLVDTSGDWVQIGESSDVTASEREQLLNALHGLSPWRKGPFRIFGVDLDCEWVSYLKWNRLKDRIAPLAGRRILDIGSSCGYYLYRMAEHAPALALGIEPYLTFYFQYRLLQHYARVPNVYTLPCKLEELPVLKRYFDTVFCMGILYHRRSPIDSLKEIHGQLRRGGELVLETLVLHGEEELALFPEKRYAKMNNVYFIPTVSCLTHWLHRAGFENVCCVDVSTTTPAEQRKTEWIQTESLEDFLDPEDPGKTIEGYPAPVRAILTAQVR